MPTFENKQTVEILKVSSRLLDKQTEAVPYHSSPLKKKKKKVGLNHGKSCY